MKNSINKDALTTLKSIILLILVSLIISLLYSFDVITTGLFSIFCQLNGFLFYGLCAVLMCRFISKRVMIFALPAAVIMIIAYLSTQTLTFKNTVFFFLKIFFFLSVILLFKNKKV